MPFAREGVYKHVSGLFEGGHSVKIIGWGTDDTTSEPYWLVANSWGVSWVRIVPCTMRVLVALWRDIGGVTRVWVLQGEEQGFFRIRRGTDECYIESNAIAGLPTAAVAGY